MPTTNNTMSKLEISDLMIMVTIIQVSIYVLCLEYQSCHIILNDIDDSLRRLEYKYDSTYKRKTWSDVLSTIPDTPFKRMFRCNKQTLWHINISIIYILLETSLLYIFFIFFLLVFLIIWSRVLFLKNEEDVIIFYLFRYI
jgi:hypothetical protein